ncbi:MAG: hypothetical protein K2I80_11195 [Ruminococcus sp.]|nr:hypothetical protein [Ruminococcus sp.]
MKKLRILSAFLAVLISVSTCSCGLKKNKDTSFSKKASSDVSKDKSEVKKSERKTPPTEYVPADMDEIRKHANQLLDDYEISENDEKIKDDIDVLLYDLDLVNDSLSYITVDYYLDWNNEKTEEKYDSCYEDFYAVYEIISYVFTVCSLSEEYGSLFEEFVTDDMVEYYSDMDMETVEAYAREDYQFMDIYLDDYYEMAYSDDLNDDEKNLLCAKIYLDILENYETDTFYEQYSRDYTPEEITELCDVIRSEIVPVYNQLFESLYDFEALDDIIDSPVYFENPFEEILKYASELSPDIEKSAKKIIDENLYTIASGYDCYDGSFTVDMPAQNSALVYMYDDESFQSFLTAVHEFGHFHASFYDDITTFRHMNNLDIAEIQSQGFEFLLIQFYDDIYGKQSDAMKILKTATMLESVISGFLIGEFEYTVLENRDEMSPKDVLECYDEIMGDLSEGLPFYYVTHIFEQPAYYISYGTSALASFEIFGNPDKALELYENIAQIPCNSDEYQFKSALEKCGFSDVLNEEYIKNLAENIKKFSEEITG